MTHHNCTRDSRKFAANLRNKRSTLAITKKLNHSNFGAQQGTGGLGKLSCVKLKWYLWRKFRDVGRNYVDVMSDVVCSLEKQISQG